MALALDLKVPQSFHRHQPRLCMCCSKAHCRQLDCIVKTTVQAQSFF